MLCSYFTAKGTIGPVGPPVPPLLGLSGPTITRSGARAQGLLIPLIDSPKSSIRYTVTEPITARTELSEAREGLKLQVPLTRERTYRSEPSLQLGYQP